MTEKNESIRRKPNIYTETVFRKNFPAVYETGTQN